MKHKSKTKKPLTRAAEKKKRDEMTPEKFLRKFGRVTKTQRGKKR